MDVLRLPPGQPLPSLNCSVNVSTVYFDAAAPSARAFGGEKGGSAAEVGIQHDVVALSGIQNRVGNERNWLNRRMQMTGAVSPIACKAVGARLMPNVGAISPEPPQLHIVEVQFLAVSGYKNEFMPG
jgi:hypothetical protein